MVSAVTRELLAARNLGTLLHDPFANYVMQTLVTVASEEDIEHLVAKVQPPPWAPLYRRALRSCGRVCLLIRTLMHAGAAAPRVAAQYALRQAHPGEALQTMPQAALAQVRIGTALVTTALM